jgi:hypothetical protein
MRFETAGAWHLGSLRNYDTPTEGEGASVFVLTTHWTRYN